MKSPEVTFRTYRVAAAVLNVRHAPGRDHRVLGRLPYGMLVEAAEAATPGWGTTGWLPVLCRLRDGDLLIGYASAVHLEPLTEDGGQLPSWLAVASREIGVREYPGPAANPRIREYCREESTRLPEDEMPWCSAFVNWCLEQSGHRGTDSAASHSWLAWGRPAEPPRLGCVAILQRGDPAWGRVGFYLQRRGAVIDLLGADPGHRVSVSSFPTAQVLGYRWPEAGETAAG